MGMVASDSVEYSLEVFSDIQTNNFALSETAWKYTELFRLDEDNFNGSFDRENEIRHCYIREIDFLSAFRSFAWCIGEYCRVNNTTASSLDLNTLLSIAQLVESRSCLNYTENSHFPALCSVPDMFTAYIPKGNANPLSPKVRFLLKDNNDAEFVYIADLNKLRSELSELHPCIEKIYRYLLSNRDRTRHLKGIASDILYTWCSFTIAANKAFMLGSAPMNYSFDICGSESLASADLPEVWGSISDAEDDFNDDNAEYDY